MGDGGSITTFLTPLFSLLRNPHKKFQETPPEKNQVHTKYRATAKCFSFFNKHKQKQLLNALIGAMKCD